MSEKFPDLKNFAGSIKNISENPAIFKSLDSLGGKAPYETNIS
jgi:hypothetical protein